MGEADLIWSVSDVNSAMKDMVENSLYPFWLKGEVSNLTLHRSGHVYCTLKDEKSQLRAVFFNGAKSFRELNIVSGSMIEARGKLTVYMARGEYQFSILELRNSGVGDMQKKFELLKNKLAAEGLFDPSRKKVLPALPRCIGIVSSPTGAALRDFLNIVDRRFPRLHFKIYPCLVQGESAAESVKAGLEFFNRTGEADVIVVTRGGGSMEDLWPFNEEPLVRAVAASRIPVISAIGHEIDFTLCDFAADLRAPTPSAAAELVVGEFDALHERTGECAARLKELAEYRLLSLKNRLMAAEGSFKPESLLNRVREDMRRTDEYDNTFSRLLENFIFRNKSRLDVAAERLSGLSVDRQLSRGFALLFDAGGSLVRSAANRLPDELFRARLADGELVLRNVPQKSEDAGTSST